MPFLNGPPDAADHGPLTIDSLRAAHRNRTVDRAVSGADAAAAHSAPFSSASFSPRMMRAAASTSATWE